MQKSQMQMIAEMITALAPKNTGFVLFLFDNEFAETPRPMQVASSIPDAEKMRMLTVYLDAMKTKAETNENEPKTNEKEDSK